MIESSGSHVVVGTYNVKNWFAPEDSSVELGKRPKPPRELDSLAQNIARSGADVVTLQEVGTSEANVKNFFDTKLPGKFPYLAYKETNDGRGIHVAVASRYPITNVVSHAAEHFPFGDGTGETHFSRDLLRADVDVKGIPMTVYTTHAKSRRTYAANDPAHPGGNDPSNQRIGEGNAIANIVAREMKEFPGRLYVVTGDMNDGTMDKSVQAVINPKVGEKRFDTLEGKSEDERRTWPADPKKANGHEPEQFDHILVPQGQKWRLVDSHVVDLPVVSKTASDHLEIVADFKLNDQPSHM